MDEELRGYIDTIIENVLALQNESAGSLTDKQRNALKIIFANAEKFILKSSAFHTVSLEQVTADMRHDLGNPLTPIFGYSELLELGIMGTLNDQQKKRTRVILETTRKLQEMVDTIVQNARNRTNQDQSSTQSAPSA